MPVPTYDNLFIPLLAAIRQLGGSASIPEQERVVAEILSLTEKEIAEIHRGNRTKLSYRLAWARNYLKRFGLLDNSKRGVWSLTSEGLKNAEVDKDMVKRTVEALKRKDKTSDEETASDSIIASWEEELLELVKSISSAAFERLCQRLLRESRRCPVLDIRFAWHHHGHHSYCLGARRRQRKVACSKERLLGLRYSGDWTPGW